VVRLAVGSRVKRNLVAFRKQYDKAHGLKHFDVVQSATLLQPKEGRSRPGLPIVECVFRALTHALANMIHLVPFALRGFDKLSIYATGMPPPATMVQAAIFT
jgi:hypothetical protein